MSISRVAFHFTVVAEDPSPRFRYVIDTLCTWFNWTCSWIELGELDERWEAVAGFGESLYYGNLKQLPPALQRRPPTLVLSASSFMTKGLGEFPVAAHWGAFAGVTCPMGDDPFAGIFWCLALCGEMGQTQLDQYGRPGAELHPLVMVGLHRIPHADRLAMALAKQLTRGDQRAQVWVEQPRTATSDIDAPLAFSTTSLPERVRGIAVGVAVDVKAGRFALPNYKNWLLGSRDPFENFDFMAEQLAMRGLQQDVFTLVGYGTRVDPGYPHGDKRWIRLWQAVAKTGRLGIHPSYYSSDRPEMIAAEKETLEQALGEAVLISRQHFLRFRLPQTFRLLLELGIREEHSLMWAGRAGFRAGTARSFYWYDLEREKQTELLMVPPHGMDVTARYQNKLGPNAAVADWQELAQEAARSGAASRLIWHNSNLGEYAGWWPWREAYTASLDLLLEGES